MHMHPSARAVHSPNRVAYVISPTGVEVTYKELDQRSNQGAQLFRKIGLMPGDHIAIMMENNEYFLEIILAAQRCGLIYTAISSHLKGDELAYILKDCDAKAFITSNVMSGVTADLSNSLDREVCLFMVNGRTEQFESWEESLLGLPEAPVSYECAGVQMLYSSGTTGRPKGIYPSWESGSPIDSIPPNISLLANFFKFNEQTVYLSPAPLYHAAPLMYSLAVLFFGGTVVIEAKYDSCQVLSSIETYRVNIAQFVPIMFIRMLKLEPDVRARYDLSSLRYAIHAAAPCPREVKQAMIDWWGPILVEYYGSTEGMGFTLLDSDQWLTHQGSVGLPMGCDVHILDADGTEVPNGEIGEIFFANPRNSFSYYKDPEKTAACRNKHGWVSVGDVGFLDDDGYLYLSDRKDFMINSGGVNIYPQEIENTLVLHPKVADAGVVGVPCDEFGQQVYALLQPLNAEDIINADMFLDEIRRWCSERLSSVKTPRIFEVSPQLPRYDNGKLYKKKILGEYLQRIS